MEIFMDEIIWFWDMLQNNLGLGGVDSSLSKTRLVMTGYCLRWVASLWEVTDTILFFYMLKTLYIKEPWPSGSVTWEYCPVHQMAAGVIPS